MGAWISLIQFKFFKKQIKGFLGIGSAPEFLEGLMWNKFTKKMKNEIKKKGVINLGGPVKTIFNFAPIIDIEQGIPDYIDWFLNQSFYLIFI